MFANEAWVQPENVELSFHKINSEIRFQIKFRVLLLPFHIFFIKCIQETLVIVIRKYFQEIIEMYIHGEILNIWIRLLIGIFLTMIGF